MSLPEVLVILLAVAVGAVVQGSIGFGFGLVAVPVMGLVEPRLLPATMLILSFPLTVWMALRERHAVDVRGLLQIVPGRVVGTIAGAWVVAIISVAHLSVLVGATIVAAVALSGAAPDFELGIRARVLAGIVSGFMATAAAVGGPPLALAYQHRPGPELRSTVAASFVIGTVFSLVALWVVGKTETVHAVTALYLLPGLVAGLALSTVLRDRLRGPWLRWGVLTFALVSGMAAIARGIA